LRLESVGDGHEYAMLIYAKPGTTGHGIDAGDDTAGAREDSRGLAPPRVDFLAIGAYDKIRVFDDAKEQR